jgi:hypothetical protein
MSSILILAGGWLLAMIASEVALRGTKLQTGLARVLVVYFLIGGGLLLFFIISGNLGPVACTVFWSGCFLSWFGVRSHLESSILLRMLFLLKKRAWTAQELLTEYNLHYGEAARLEELVRGGLTGPGTGVPALTSKGKTIVRIVSLLNRSRKFTTK